VEEEREVKGEAEVKVVMEEEGWLMGFGTALTEVGVVVVVAVAVVVGAVEIDTGTAVAAEIDERG